MCRSILRKAVSKDEDLRSDGRGLCEMGGASVPDLVALQDNISAVHPTCVALWACFDENQLSRNSW